MHLFYSIAPSARRVLAWAPILGGSLSLVLTTLPASGETALLQLQKATTVAGPWQTMPANRLGMTPEGNLADTIAGTGFYRLQISTSDAGGGPITVPLQSVSAQTLQLAQHMLDSSPGGGNAWEN